MACTNGYTENDEIELLTRLLCETLSFLTKEQIKSVPYKPNIPGMTLFSWYRQHLMSDINKRNNVSALMRAEELGLEIEWLPYSNVPNSEKYCILTEKKVE